LTVHICVLLNDFWLFLWVIAGTFFGLAYSVKPFHFKVRGVFHVTLAFGAGLAPMIFLYYIIGGIPTTSAFLVILFFIILHYGIALVNQTQDYLEDKESGLLTPAVRWGVTQTLTASLIISLIGLFLGFIGFYILFNDLPSLTILSYTLSFELLYTITVITLIISYYTPVKGIWDLIMISSGRETIEQKMNMIKNRLNYPRWQASGIFGLMVISIIFFSIKIF
jgi:4-hydroxybenzoate polyprenyltransferase